MPSSPDIPAVRAYLLALQDAICAALEQADGSAHFRTDEWQRPAAADAGSATPLRREPPPGGRTRVLADGAVFEKAGVNFSHVRGGALPASATAHRPELANRPWEALGVSLVIHPRNPYVPTTHANIRFFCADPAASPETCSVDLEASSAAPAAPAWWFGGGFDLTPYYGFVEDGVHWHRTARDAVRPFGEAHYTRFKQWCDDYFFLKHRAEPRGIGGLFFDDFNELGFDRSFALARAVGDAFLPAYLPIVRHRRDTPYGERERRFQLCRRGRYVEFNLVYDRGTLFGLQSGGRTESILMSLPPLVRWDYDAHPAPGTPEAALHQIFLQPRDWATLSDSQLSALHSQLPSPASSAQ